MKPIYRRQDEDRRCEYDFTAANVLTCRLHGEHHILIGYLGPEWTARTLAELREKGLLRGKALEMARGSPASIETVSR